MGQFMRGGVARKLKRIISGLPTELRRTTARYTQRTSVFLQARLRQKEDTPSSLLLLFIGIMFLFLVAVVLWGKEGSAAPGMPPGNGEGSSGLDEKPRYNWRVCEDLGVGPVPGLTEPRQRLRLCHNQGWEVLVYCIRPELPVPEVGVICSRVSEDVYWCGEGRQPVKEYRTVQEPDDTPTPTSTPTYTPTATHTGTPTPTPTETLIPVPPKPTRTPPGGRGYRSYPEFLGDINGITHETFHQASQTRSTPSMASYLALSRTNIIKPEMPDFYGIDFQDGSREIQIKIYPPDRRVNAGSPIVIRFLPSISCSAEGEYGCIRKYKSGFQSEVTFVTIHSGLGGTGQEFRRALEGNGYNQAGYPLSQVKKNLNRLEGAQVVISQGKKTIEGFHLAALTRIPGDRMLRYLNRPISKSLGYASNLDPSIEPYVNPGIPQLVFETCGWRMPEEPYTAWISDTSASIYLGVVQKIP